LLLKIATGSPYRLMILLTLAMLLIVVWAISFKWIERIYGLGGLLLVVFIGAFVGLGPDWSAMAGGLLPVEPAGANPRESMLYLFYAVALLSSIMLPYETYFYASGGIEDEWQPKDVNLNRAVVLIGFALGGLLAASLLGVGSAFFASRGIEPQLPGAAALGAGHVFGMWGVAVALLGMFFAFSGAAIETALASAYNLAQFAGWPWGKHRPKRETGRFTLSWIAIFLLASLVALSGADPVSVVEYSIVFSVVILPLTYFPVLMVARDKRIMGSHVNGVIADALGWFYLALIAVAAVAALPLFILTHGGKG
jgi:Mn2+/Fe2+ NRAMP family transporter